MNFLNSLCKQNQGYIRKDFYMSFFKFEVPAYNIRRPNLNSKIQRASLDSRGTKHDNLFREKTPLPTNCAGFSPATFEQIQIAHQVRDLFLLSNEELMRFFLFVF